MWGNDKISMVPCTNHTECIDRPKPTSSTNIPIEKFDFISNLSLHPKGHRHDDDDVAAAFVVRAGELAGVERGRQGDGADSSHAQRHGRVQGRDSILLP